MNRFAKHSGCFRCDLCGKMTRETGEGETDSRSCKDCMRAWAIENDIENDKEIGKDDMEFYKMQSAKWEQTQ